MTERRPSKRRKSRSKEERGDNDVAFADDAATVARVMQLIEQELARFDSDDQLEAHYLSHLPPLPRCCAQPAVPPPPSPAAAPDPLADAGRQYIDNAVHIENLQLAVEHGDERRDSERRRLEAEAERLRAQIKAKLAARRSKRQPQLSIDDFVGDASSRLD